MWKEGGPQSSMTDVLVEGNIWTQTHTGEGDVETQGEDDRL